MTQKQCSRACWAPILESCRGPAPCLFSVHRHVRRAAVANAHAVRTRALQRVPLAAEALCACELVVNTRGASFRHFTSCLIGDLPCFAAYCGHGRMKCVPCPQSRSLEESGGTRTAGKPRDPDRPKASHARQSVVIRITPEQLVCHVADRSAKLESACRRLLITKICGGGFCGTRSVRQSSHSRGKGCFCTSRQRHSSLRTRAAHETATAAAVRAARQRAECRLAQHAPA